MASLQRTYQAKDYLKVKGKVNLRKEFINTKAE